MTLPIRSFQLEILTSYILKRKNVIYNRNAKKEYKFNQTLNHIIINVIKNKLQSRHNPEKGKA